LDDIWIFTMPSGHSALDGSTPDAFYYRHLAALEQAA
jgi:hypothetical protein